MKNKFEIFLDTDIFLDYLSGMNLKEDSLLKKCTGLFDGCYTSVINASEILSEYTGKRKTDRAKRSFEGIGILGIPFRYSEKIAEVMNVIKKKSPETLLGML